MIDAQQAHIADLKENIEALESTIEELKSENLEAAQLVDELESKSEQVGQQVEDLQSESSEREEMLNDLRCRSHIDVELVPGGCDWEPPDSMPRQVNGWTWSKWDDGDTLSITYAVAGEGEDPLLQPSLRLYCVWGVNSQVFMGIDVRENLHEAGEVIVSVDYLIGGTERFEVPWRSYSHSGGGTSLSPDWGYDDMVLDDLRAGTGTLEVMIALDDRPPMQAVFEIDGIAEVFELLEPGCRDRNAAIRGNAA